MAVQEDNLVFDASFIDEIEQDENERKATIESFVANMSRPDRVVPEDEEPEGDTPSVSASNDKNGESAKNDESDNNTGEAGKDTFNLFDFLELDNVADWWEGALLFGSIKAHDYFDDSVEIQQARERIVAALSDTNVSLSSEQKDFLKKRYDELGEALQERRDGRDSLKEDIEFPEKLKEKFNQIFKKWFETKQLNVDLSPGWALVIMIVGTMIWSLVIVGKTRYKYRKV